jgi:hypothetical protein
MPALKTTPLCNDNDELTKWLETQLDPTSFSKKYTFEEIKQFLTEWLNPEEAEASAPQSAGDEFLDLPKAEKPVVPQANKAFALKPKETIAEDEFEDLFK